MRGGMALMRLESCIFDGGVAGERRLILWRALPRRNVASLQRLLQRLLQRVLQRVMQRLHVGIVEMIVRIILRNIRNVVAINR